jgi:hypothetical protein
MSLTAEEILAIANNASTPVLLFGSAELDAWNKEHFFRDYCHTESVWYVVLHTTPHIPNSPYFRVLCRWHYGRNAPTAFDVPQTTLAAA